jgi:hypothetical protein
MRAASAHIGLVAAAVVLGISAAPVHAASTGGTAPIDTTPHGPTGGTMPGTPQPHGRVAKLVHGVAIAPVGAPARVRRVIAAGNRLQRSPYRYGGGHRSFKDTAYDCSGTVSYALHGGSLLASPLDSTSLESWGLRGRGSWITVYANAGHAYMIVAGLRLDTSGTGGSGPRWQTASRSSAGFLARHPAGL